MQKRSRVTITIDILEATLKPQKKTRIIYQTNLNYVRFNRYLEEFLSKDFIEAQQVTEGNNYYRITQRGKTLLGLLRKVNVLGYE